MNNQTCPEHGVKCSTAYRSRKCRCDECKSWKSSNRLLHKESQKRAHEKWVKNNPDKKREWRRKSDERARRAKGVPERVFRNPSTLSDRKKSWRALTTEERQEVKKLRAYRDRLQELTGVVLHLDHIIPLAQGGASSVDNLMIITASDNQYKGPTSPDMLDLYLVPLSGIYRI